MSEKEIKFKTSLDIKNVDGQLPEEVTKPTLEALKADDPVGIKTFFGQLAEVTNNRNTEEDETVAKIALDSDTVPTSGIRGPEQNIYLISLIQ